MREIYWGRRVQQLTLKSRCHGAGAVHCESSRRDEKSSVEDMYLDRFEGQRTKQRSA